MLDQLDELDELDEPGQSEATDRRDAMLDGATIDRLSRAFNRCFETQEVPADLFTPDAFFDLLPPLWRFQLEGPDVFEAQLRATTDGDVTARIVRVVPTASGFLLEHEETQRTEVVHTARRLWLCAVRDGRISEVTGYCNGPWDDELKARHAAEAPMLRPDSPADGGSGS